MADTRKKKYRPPAGRVHGAMRRARDTMQSLRDEISALLAVNGGASGGMHVADAEYEAVHRDHVSVETFICIDSRLDAAIQKRIAQGMGRIIQATVHSPLECWVEPVEYEAWMRYRDYRLVVCAPFAGPDAWKEKGTCTEN